MASVDTADPAHRRSGHSTSDNAPLRAVAMAAAFTAAVGARPSLLRRWSRKAVQSTPPPLPLISLPPDDEWEEFDVPAKTGFGYSLPDVGLDNEEIHDESASGSFGSFGSHDSQSGQSSHRGYAARHDRAAICRTLSEYMAQNEVFQVRRHGFGIDTKLVYKRHKSNVRARSSFMPHTASAFTSDPIGGGGGGGDDAELGFNAFFESGNLDRAYRVLGRHYATTQELLGGGSSSSSTTNASTRPSGAPATAAPSPWSAPFPFFVKADMEYDLYCDTDVSTHGHIQWYFFRVVVPAACLNRATSSATTTTTTTTTTTLRVRFNLRNMLKKASLYNDGMLPAVYIDGVRGWHHAGANVCYFKNADTYRHRKSGKTANYYTLSFVYEFQLPPSLVSSSKSSSSPSSSSSSSPPLTVYFAHCYPYTFTRLQKYLLALQKDPERNRFFRRRVLCKTIAGNICDVLTITDFAQEDDLRCGIVLTARVHPGESNASFIMHGILDFLTGPSLEARYLRHRFVFKIVPMLNPDGVIHGNYRCSLAGTDLNRRYVDPSPELHPTVFATKSMVLSMSKTRHVSLYCDIHGHSRKKNIFLYGCVPFDDENAGYARGEAAKLRLFPHVLCKTCPSTGPSGFYSFPDCTFSVSKSKKGTGRVVVWDEAHVLNSFTLEASFFGVGVNKSSKRGLAPVVVTSSSSNQRGGGGGDGSGGGGGGGAGSNNQAAAAAAELGMTHFMPTDLRLAGAKFCLALIPFAHLLDRDRPPPPPMACSSSGSTTTTTNPPAFTYSGRAEMAPMMQQPIAAGGFGGMQPRPQTSAGFPVRGHGHVTQPTTLLSRSSPRDEQLLSSSSPSAADSKVRLAPLHPASTTASTPFLPPCSLSKKSLLLHQSSSSSSLPPASLVPTTAASAPAFDSLFGMDAMFASMASSTDDLLREIEDTLPDNFSSHGGGGGGDSDDEGDESAGSESDPSGDNMEDEELQRQDSWKTLVPDHGAATTSASVETPPKLIRNRSQTMLKRFSDSILRIGMLAEELEPHVPPPEPTVVSTPPPSETPAPRTGSRELAKIKPSAVLAPVKTPPGAAAASPAHQLRRRPSGQQLPAHQRDRNREIATLHLRAVQRRSRTKRAGRQIPVNEQDLH